MQRKRDDDARALAELAGEAHGGAQPLGAGAHVAETMAAITADGGIETGAVVVPIAHNSGECWPKNSFIKRPGLVTVSIGKPISPLNHTPDSLMQEVENWIESEMRVISPHVYTGG